MNYKIFTVIIPLTLLFVVSCEQPLDPVIEAVDETNAILTTNYWNLESFVIEVKNEDIPPPLLFNSTDSLIRNGMYDLDDMVLDGTEMQTYMVRFTEDRKILTNGGQLDIISDSIGKYFVFNEHTVRISNSEQKLRYRYLYNPTENSMSLTLSSEDADALITDVNQKLIKYVSGRTPNKVGDKIGDILFNNEKLKQFINDFLVSIISGKLEIINELNPEQAAEKLSKEIFEAIESVDWQAKLTEIINSELEKLTDIDPEAVSESIAEDVTQFVQERLSTEAIYNMILPYMEQIPVNSEAVAERISTLIVSLMFDVFGEDLLQPAITSALTKFTELEETKVVVVGDTLASIVEDIWINPENISTLFLPFTQKIEDTPLTQMGNLAAEATDSLEDLINVINAKFPDLNLSPDYDNIETVIKAAFIAAKPVIGAAGGAEEAALSIANAVINQFLNHEFISNVFVNAIQKLQRIDPEVAGSTISTWLINLGESVSPEIIEHLSNLLSPMLENIDPNYLSFQIAMALNNFIETKVTQESVQALIYPLLVKYADINTKAVSRVLAKLILNLDVIKNNVTQENIEAILLPVLQNIQETNVDQLSQNLINAIVDSGIFESVITEQRISTIISLMLYKSAWDNVKIANNFEEASITLRHE